MAVMQASEASINFVKTRLASPDGKLWGKAPGMVLIKPTSIAHSGTSASIGENGQVTFSAVTSLSLNGVFGAGFDNYFVFCSSIASTNAGLHYRLRTSGSDATGTNYVSQQLQATGGPPGIAVNRQTNNYGRCGTVSITLRAGRQIAFYGPALAKPTAIRTTDVNGAAEARLDDRADTHSLTTSYDGVTFFPASGSITGKLAVYGVRS